MENFAVVVVGLVFIIIGLFEWSQKQDKEADIRRRSLFAELEIAKLENIHLRGRIARERRLKLEARVNIEN